VLQTRVLIPPSRAERNRRDRKIKHRYTICSGATARYMPGDDRYATRASFAMMMRAPFDVAFVIFHCFA